MALKVLLIGAGYFGQLHLEAWQRIKGVSLVGIHEKDASKAAALKTRYPQVRVESDLSLMVANLAPDILDIATPPDTHEALIQQWLGQVRAIICQKPFCGNYDAAKRVARNGEKSGTVLAVHENFRFQPWYRKIRSLMDDDELGTISQIRFSLRPGDGRGDTAYRDRQPYFRSMERFLVHETAVHQIDVLRYLVGTPSSIYADLWQVNSGIKGEDAGLLHLQFEGGQRGIIDANRTLDHPAENCRLTMGEMLIEGEKGSLGLTGDGQVLIRQFGEKRWEPIALSFDSSKFGGGCVEAFQRHVVEHLEMGAPLETHVQDYMVNLTVVDAAYRSNEQQCRINL